MHARADAAPRPDEPQFRFTADELERLAQVEHIRWMNDKLASGWRYGPVRDDAHRIHDQLKPWSELDEENRQWNRDAVLKLPQVLELAGFKIQKQTEPVEAG